MIFVPGAVNLFEFAATKGDFSAVDGVLQDGTNQCCAEKGRGAILTSKLLKAVGLQIFGKTICTCVGVYILLKNRANCGLPIGNDWLDHLDGLRLIRMNTWGSMRKFSDYYASQLNGYICVGIEKNTSEYHKALEILNDARIAPEILIDNELLENYVRLAIHGKSQIDYKRTIHRENLIAWPQEQLEAMWKVWELYSSDETKLETVKENFIKLWDRHPVLHTVRGWWEHIPGTLDITRTGKIIAHTNVKRCDPTIPDLEL